ncbi:sterol-binding protein [Phakopsora pachyrhizi]|nr:sterol-binding protein [Phakopsora pachyrhizi]
MSEKEKKDQIKKVNGLFQLNIKNPKGQVGQWAIDFKKEAQVYKGTTKTKADVTIDVSDDTFQTIADGKLTGQKAFMSGQLKVKGNIMLATKLDTVLKTAKSKL